MNRELDVSSNPNVPGGLQLRTTLQASFASEPPPSRPKASYANSAQHPRARAVRVHCICGQLSGPAMHSRYCMGVQRTHVQQMCGRIRGPLRPSAAAQQPRSLPHGRTAQEADVGLRPRSPRTVATHAGRTATLDRHVSIESWEEELQGRRQHCAAVRRAEGSSSITPWRRSSAGSFVICGP